MEVKDTWLALQKAGTVVFVVSVIGFILGNVVSDSNIIIFGSVIIANLIAAKNGANRTPMTLLSGHQ